MESNETLFNAEQNEIEYEDAMTEQAATVQRLTTENAALRTELAAANAKVAELTDELAKANAKAHEVARLLAGLSWQLMGKDE